MLAALKQLETEIERLQHENSELKQHNTVLINQLKRHNQMLFQNKSPCLPVFQLKQHISDFLLFCESQKHLSANTLKSYNQSLTLYLKYLQKKNIDHTFDSLFGYIDLIKKAVQPRTVKCRISALKTFHSFLVAQNLFPENPFDLYDPVVEVPPSLPPTLTKLEVERLLLSARTQTSLARAEHNSTQLRRCLLGEIILSLLIFTGLQVSELCRIQENDVDLQKRTLLLGRNTKKERIIQLDDEIICTLHDYAKECLYEGSLFFITSSCKPISPDIVRRIVRKHAELAGIKKVVSPQTLRSTFAVHRLEDGVPLDIVQSILGLTCADAAARYKHTENAILRKTLSVHSGTRKPEPR